MVAKQGYVPEAGDVVWIELNPTRGHEQAGKRPALVISPKIYNAKAGLILACPVTSQQKEYPFEVPLNTRTISGVILADQIRSLAWKERRARKAVSAPASVLAEVKEHLGKLLVL